MTIREIARQLGMSEATVSLCLAGKERDKRFCIKPDKAERIRAFARSVGYVPNYAASRLRSRSCKSPIGLLLARTSGLEKYFPLLRNAMTLLEKNGRQFFTMGYAVCHMGEALAILKSMGVEHVVVFGYVAEPVEKNQSPDSVSDDFKKAEAADSELIKRLSAEMKIYLTDYAFPRPQKSLYGNVFRMGIDRYKMLNDIVSQVNNADLGPVALGTWGAYTQGADSRYLASPELLIPLDFSDNRFADGEKFAIELIKAREKNHIRTVIIGNDEAAAGCVAKLMDLGIKIPEEIGIIGFGDGESAPYFRLPLTSIRCGVLENIRKIIQAIIDGEEIPEETELDYQLIIRESFKFPQCTPDTDSV